jgi:predicted metalloprotease with PDZ domain
VAYELSFDRAARIWDVEARFPAAQADGAGFWIARWTAGAYHVAEYGRFARELVALDGTGEKLSVERVDDSHWVIATNAREPFVVRYKAESISSGQLDAGVFDVEANRIRDDYAYLTPVSLLGFVPGFQQLPISLGVDQPDGWRTATSMVADEDGRYTSATSRVWMRPTSSMRSRSLATPSRPARLRRSRASKPSSTRPAPISSPQTARLSNYKLVRRPWPSKASSSPSRSA